MYSITEGFSPILIVDFSPILIVDPMLYSITEGFSPILIVDPMWLHWGTRLMPWRGFVSTSNVPT